jgi:hypothetical protein
MQPQRSDAACYQTALQRNRKLRGRMVLSFTAEP